MTISEKSAYLKGLMDGLKLNTEAPEGQMIEAIVGLLGDISKKLTDVEDTTIAISDELDEIEEDLDAIEDFMMELEDEDDCCCGCCDCDDCDCDCDCDDCYDEDEDYDYDCEPGFDFGDEDSIIYEAECECGNIMEFDEDTLEKGSIICDNCGELLEFTFDEEDEDEE